MANKLPGIDYITDVQDNRVVPFVSSKYGMYEIPYYKGIEYFSNVESYVKFIKGCERMVRQNDRYKKYIHYLKKEIGLTHCQVLPDIEPDEDGKIDIEMHHGPILTLYDICEIMIEYFLIKERRITTFSIADAVLEEHQKNRVQVVMLLATVHEEVHNRNIFINYKHAWGDLDAFIKKYGIAISDTLKIKINRYIDRSLLNDSNDYGVLKLNDSLLKL